GPDGPTHAGSFDYSYMRCIPNMLVMAPADENECRQMLYTGFMHQGPASVRYPRGKGPGVAVNKTMTAFPIGKAEVRHQGSRIAILAWGSMVAPSMEVGKQLGATVVNMRFVKPIDTELVLELAKSHEVFITVEENVLAGGAGSAVNDFLQAQQILMPVLNIGLPDSFVEQGTREELLALCGLDVQGILAKAEKFCA
ncbi:MAG: transketolase C-terminal domain-containing protein, partial [Methylobacter sp.]